MLTEYIRAAMGRARYEPAEECRKELESALEDWILLEKGTLTLILPNPHSGEIGKKLLSKLLRQAAKDAERHPPRHCGR